MTSEPQLSHGQITIGGYILERMSQLGVKQIYGVPGDYNLVFLDLIEDHPDLDWVGCCNELNASYAADGYARVSQAGIGCLATAFGVGELSAINGIAGAHAERIPIFHVVGAPVSSQQADRAILHHTLGDGCFDKFGKMSEQVTCAQSLLTSSKNATQEIDRLLKAALTYSQPVYMTLPMDLVNAPVSSSSLKVCLRKQVAEELEAQTDPTVLEVVLGQISDLYSKSEKPIVILDACARRFKVESEAVKLVEAIQIPVFTTPMGKTSISESHPLFAGTYMGALTPSEVKRHVENSDLIIFIGGIMSDLNTGNFSFQLGNSKQIELHSTETIVQCAHYPSVGFRKLLPLLTERLSLLPKKIIKDSFNLGDLCKTPDLGSHEEEQITQEDFWPLWAKNFFQKNDVILGEAGTSMFGLFGVQFPDGALFLSQILWGSIGWSTGACLGAAQAAEEQGRRTILFIGDGSLQVSVQEISTMVRAGVKPIIVILDNDGYTIERLFLGPTRKYNDIQPWNWAGILDLFNPQNTTPTLTHCVETHEKLVELLENPDFKKAECIQVVVAKLGKFDVPSVLKLQVDLMTEERNRRASLTS